MPVLQPGAVLRGQLSNYTICELLGQGGMGAVHKAQDSKGKFWAVKELAPPSELQTELRLEILQGFRREAELLQKVHHKHIPQFVERIDADGSSYIVMEFIHGKNLADYVENGLGGARQESYALRWMGEITSAVDACHAMNMLHGDIKPSNIIITDTGNEAYLVDFGVSLPIETSEVTLGPRRDPLRHATSQYFSAPEKYGDRVPITERSDIFSIGATFYYFLAGEPPPHPVDRWQTKQEQLSVRKANSDVGFAFDDVIDACTRLLPEERFQTTQELTDAIRSIADGAAGIRRLSDSPPLSRESKVNVPRFSRVVRLEDYVVRLPDGNGLLDPPTHLALADENHLLLAWSSGHIACLQIRQAHKQGKLTESGRSKDVFFTKAVCPVPLTEILGLAPYRSGGKIGCVVYGQRGRKRLMVDLREVCDHPNLGLKEIELPESTCVVGRFNASAFGIFRDRDETYFGEIEGAKKSAAKTAISSQCERIPHCTMPRGAVVASSYVYVAGFKTNRIGQVWLRQRKPTVRWEQLGGSFGTPVAITGPSPWVSILHRGPFNFDQWVTLIEASSGREEDSYFLEGLPLVESIAVDTEKRLWLASDEALHCLPWTVWSRMARKR